MIDQHGCVCRFAAVVEEPDGSILAEMLDVCECDAAARIRLIFTFLGMSPPPPT